MGTLGLGRVGISLDIAGDGSHLDDAATVESLGYSTIWLAGGQLDRLSRLAELLEATTTIGVAPGIISPDVYSAAGVLAFYAGLPAAARDRLIVGVGGSQQPRSLAALNAYLDALDGGDPPIPASRRVLAALGPRKLDLARTRCAGAITLLVTPAYTATARRALGDTATLVVSQFVVLDADPARARAATRDTLAFLSAVPGYRVNFERMGFSAAEIAGPADRLVDELVAWGDPDAIAARVAEQLAAGADQVVLSPLHVGDQPGPVEVARQLATRLPDLA